MEAVIAVVAVTTGFLACWVLLRGADASKVVEATGSAIAEALKSANPTPTPLPTPVEAPREVIDDSDWSLDWVPEVAPGPSVGSRGFDGSIQPIYSGEVLPEPGFEFGEWSEE